MFEWLYLINKGVLNILGIEDVVYICFVEKGIADLNGTILPVVLEVNTNCHCTAACTWLPTDCNHFFLALLLVSLWCADYPDQSAATD